MFVPMNNWLVVEPEKTESVIERPESSLDIVRGRVVEVSAAYYQAGRSIPLPVSVGQTILYRRGVAEKKVVAGYHFVRIEDVFAVDS